jgi:uncharacterized delta-60 repeat protein
MTCSRRNLLLGLIAMILASSTVTAGPVLARTPVGRIDSAYGRSGLASVDIPGVDYALAGAPQTDGKLVLAGVAGGDLAVTRFTRHGRLDRNFGLAGVTRIEVGDLSGIGSVRVGADGGIYLAGWTQDTPRRSDAEDVDAWASFAVDRVRLLLVKLTPRGFLDPSFGAGGVVTTEPGVLQPVHDLEVDMVLTPAGSVVVLALRGVSAGWYGFAGSAVLVRFTSAGTTDASFGVGGVAPAGVPGVIPAPTALVLQPDGRLVVGATWVEPGLVPFAPPSWDLLLTRHLANGLPDATFGTGGVVRKDLKGGTDVMRELAIDRFGRIIVIGDTVESTVEIVSDQSSSTFGYSPFVLRLTASGAADPTFGRDGLSVLEGDGLDLVFAEAGAVQSDGRVLVAAFAMREDNYSTRLVRVGTDGRRDEAFGAITLPMQAATNLTTSSGRAFAGGYLRYDPDGMPDTFSAVAVVQP